jgi:outer membrane protein OmpA-like peptidoglycan-associated protein
MKNIKKTYLPLFLLFVITVWAASASYKLEESFNKSKNFVLYDFDAKTPANSLYGQSGIFDLDPNDKEASCRASYVQDDSFHNQGYFLKLSYDVNSSKPAFNGWWTKLMYADYSKLKALSISIKGDKESGFSDFFKVELKDKSNRKLEYLIEDIADQWKTFVIRFEDFEGPLDSFDWTNMNEFVIVFEDWRMKIKEGKYFVDDIIFLTQDDKTPTFAEISKRSKNQSTDTAVNKEPVKQKEIDIDTKPVNETVSNTNTTVTMETTKKEETVTDVPTISDIKEQKDVSVEINENKSIEITLKNIQFKPNSAEFADADNNKTLDLIVETLKTYKGKKITITGHTADVGDKKAQLILSIARAKTVYDYIMKNFPFDPKLVKYQGKGGTDPIADNKTKEGMAKNRRVELLIE